MDCCNADKVFGPHAARFSVDHHFETFFEAFVFGGRGKQFGRGVHLGLTFGGTQGGLDPFLIVV